MVRIFKPLALVGAALIVSSVPAMAQGTGPLGLDLDPFHIFTPAPAPAPAAKPMMEKRKMQGHKMHGHKMHGHKMMKKHKKM